MKTILLAAVGAVGLAALAGCGGEVDAADYAADPNCVAAPDLGEGYFICGPDSAAISSRAAEDGIARGREFIEANCSACHATGPNDESPLEGAPPFRELHQDYPVEDLAEALAEGIVTGHTGMPQFALTPQTIEDVISYLKSLE